MLTKSDPIHDIDFLQLLKSNQIKTPNEFTIGMGELIRAAREERELSQVELAKEINRRPATISAIENGRSEIGVLTLVLFSIVLDKPISYFFPQSLLKDMIVDLKTSFEYDVIELAKGIENFGDTKLTLDILKTLSDNFEENFEVATQDHPTEEDIP